MTSNNTVNLDIGDILLDAAKLEKFIIGCSAVLGRIERNLGLPPMTDTDYQLYSGGSTLMNETEGVYHEVMKHHGGFFGWINRNIIQPVANVGKSLVNGVIDVVKPIAKPIVEVARPLLTNPITKTALSALGPKGMMANQIIDMADTGFKMVGLGAHQFIVDEKTGSAYKIEPQGSGVSGSAYRIQSDRPNGGLYRIQGAAEKMIEASKRNVHLQSDSENYTIGEIYKFNGAPYMFTNQGFIEAPNQIVRTKAKVNGGGIIGGSYMDSNNRVVISNDKGVLGTSVQKQCSGASPSDFLQ